MKLIKLFASLVWVGLVSCTTPDKGLQHKLKNSVEILKSMTFDAQQENLQIIKALKTDVKLNGNSREGLDRIKRTQLLQSKTAQLCDSIDYWQSLVPNGSSDVQIRQVLLGKEGKKLLSALDDHVQWLDSEFKDLYLPKLARFSQPRFQRTVKTTNSIDEFLFFHFSNASISVVQTWFAQTRLQIFTYAQQILRKLGKGDLSAGMYFPRIWAIVTENSPIIKLGEIYHAELCIADIASKARPRMTLNSTPIAVLDGMADVSIQVAPIADSVPAHIDKVTRYWQGSITFKSKGRDTTLYVKKPYTVLRKSVDKTQK